MKILYDHQIFTYQQYGGISRYFYELISRFDNFHNTCDVATLYSSNAYYNENYDSKLNKNLPNFHFRGKERLKVHLNISKSLNKVKNGDFDVFHPTYYDSYFLKNIKNKPFVVTLHDMIHEKFSNEFNSLKIDKYIFENKKQLLLRSSKIIAISETSKNDIIDYFNICSDKIDVVYHGNSLKKFNIGEFRIIEEDYVLFVGNRDIYKNFIFFVKSISDLLVKYNLKLICVGGGDFTIEEIKLIKFLKLENHIKFKKLINDDVLANYYTHALFFCFPSLYEGFGIPVLEAFACGCPVLLSNGGALPEVGGDSVYYFDPRNSESIKEKFEKMLIDDELRVNLKYKGFSRLNLFSWDKSYNSTLNVYNSVM